jgi:glycosyltransferase involved in cell wall biosynthesis
MKIAGITRIRNEESIITSVLDHVSAWVDEIYVYDDCSTDLTPDICEDHKAVNGVIRGRRWASNPKERNKAEGQLRQAVYNLAVKNGATWVYYFDADEYIYPDFDKIDFNANSYSFRLFDFYITEEDKDAHFLERKWMGPEYRDIPMLFKVHPKLVFTQRIPKNYGKPKLAGLVKHYGKAISVEEWDKTCEYYVNHRWKDVSPKLQQRWKDRIGKAIHSKSDFGRELIQWKDNANIEKIIKI